jgi:hypothetical protein
MAVQLENPSVTTDPIVPDVIENENPDIVVNPDITDEKTEADPNKTSVWYDDLDADLKSNASITKFKSKADLAKSYVELQKMVGKDKIVVPTDKSTPEEWAAFYDKAGRPSEAKAYDVPEFKDVPEPIRMQQDGIEAFKAKAHELGLNKKQFAGLFGLYNEFGMNSYNQQMEKVSNDRSASETALRSEWGAAYDTKVDQAQQVINKFFTGKNIHPAFNILSSDKGFVAAMSEIAGNLTEDTIKGQSRNTLTPNEASAEINSMMGDSKHPLHNDMHPEHKAAVDRLIELRQYAEARQS